MRAITVNGESPKNCTQVSIWRCIVYWVIGLFCGAYCVSVMAASQDINVINQAEVNYKIHKGGTQVNGKSGTVIATILVSETPKISVQKTASAPIAVAGQFNVFDITYKIAINNTGTVAANYIHLSDNLNCTFHTFDKSTTVAAWEVIKTPKILTGNLLANAAYTGKAACAAKDIAHFGTDNAVQLLDGSKSLLAGESSTVEFSVRITLIPAQVKGLSFENTAVAVSLNSVDPKSELIAAAVSSSSIALKMSPLKPSGVVYNSKTRALVQGAVATLTRDTTRCQGAISQNQLYNPLAINYVFNANGSVSMTTKADGSYSFFLNTPKACPYTLSITPPDKSGLVSPSVKIPVTSGVAPSGIVQEQDQPPADTQETRYYFNLSLGVANNIWHNHIPLDPALEAGHSIFLNKESTKVTAEMGDIAPYTLTMTNATGAALDNVQIRDLLPRGFRLLSGSVQYRINSTAGEGTWKSLPDPAGAPGAPLDFNVTGVNWPDNAIMELSYQLQIGVGAALDKSSINSAYASSGVFNSNQSSWAITVAGGVFSDDAFLVGKVYLEDCDQDKVQGEPDDKKPRSKDNKAHNEKEIGIPDVRLIMEDGTSVITDVEGKYSLYGLSPITHVLKLDTTTLPKEAKLIVLDSRNAGKGDSRFVDLKKGELHKADFAVSSCNADAVVKEVQLRRKTLEAHPEQDGQALIGQRFNANYANNNLVSDPKALPASGVITPTGPQAITALDPAGKNKNLVYQTVMPANLVQSMAAQRLHAQAPNRPLVIPLENILKSLDNKPGFIELKDGDTLPDSVTNIRVKGAMGSSLRLKVNGVDEALGRVGKKSILADKNLEAWEYIGVSLKPGKNTLLLEVADTFGNIRASQSLTVIAPGHAGSIKMDAPATSIADSKTPVKVTLHLVDDNGVPVTARTQLTLELDNGTWLDKDLVPEEPGLQAFMEGGVAEFTLLPPGNPSDAIVKVIAGNLEQQLKIAFLPELRPLIGAGIIEGVVNFRAGKVNVNAPTAYDAFERELRHISVGGRDVKGSGRAAFFFKGTIKGKYLLTTAYDSDKTTQQRLFRDIQPDKFYPIYGDSSIKGFDAQSTERFYLRVDREKSYVMYGDFTTSDSSPDRRLSQYSRSATGIKGHYESGNISANAWGSHDNLAQKIIEIVPNGTSGPYRVPGMDALYENSEKVEVLVRDQNQPTIILEAKTLSRFVDYSIDLMTHEIFLKAPLSSQDAKFNPRSLRITYESTDGGEAFFKGGADARVKLTNNIEIGASYARDDNPEQKMEVMGSTAIVKLAEKTTLIAEVARTHTGKNNIELNAAQSSKRGANQTNIPSSTLPSYINQNTTGIEGEGWAERLEFRHEGTDLKANAQVTHADKNFNNPTSGFSQGRTEATANAKYKLDAQTSLVAEAIFSKGNAGGGTRMGVTAGIERIFNEMISAEFGMRASRPGNINLQQGVGALITQPAGDLLTVRGKLTAKLPWLKGADLSVEAEQDIFDLRKHMFAVGAGYLVNDQTRLYGRYELISSLNSTYALNASQQNNRAVIGVESAYSKNGRVFSEYRIRDAVNSREAQAAMGLRHTWEVADGVRLGGGFETTHAFAGQPGSDSTAITGLAEYTADPRYKLTGSLESRFADSGNSWLNTVGLVYKIDQDWSLLSRHGLSIQENSLDGSALWRMRQQIGVAWRQVDNNRWNALGRYEHRLEEQTGGKLPYHEHSHIVSTHVNYQPREDLIASARYALKWSEQNRTSTLAAKALTHLIYGRVTWDFWKDFDASLQTSAFIDEYALQFSEGIEIGYQVVNDLWASVGYNMQGFDGGDLKGTDYTAQGFYVRARFKFDEALFN